jgi:hypothetical protein
MQAVNTAKKQPLTKAQEQVFEKIRGTTGGFLKPHKRTGTGVSWKLMDAAQNPIQVFTGTAINGLLNKEYLKRKDNIIVLNEA